MGRFHRLVVSRPDVFVRSPVRKPCRSDIGERRRKCVERIQTEWTKGTRGDVFYTVSMEIGVTATEC